MWWYAAGNKTTQVLITSGMNSLDLSSSSVRTTFINGIATSKSISANSISFYYLDGADSSVTRISNGDSWALTWSGAAPYGDINGVSFAIEDAKKWLQFSADKTEIDSDGNDKVTLSATMLLANKSGTDTSFSGNLKVPLSTPDGSSKIKFSFSSGQASKSIKFSKSGVISLGTAKMAGYRMDNSVYIDVTL